AAFGVGAVTLRVTLEVGGVQDLPLFLVLRVVLFRTDEQGVGKQVVPGRLRGDFDSDVMIGVSADVQVRGVSVVLGNKGFDTAPQCIKFFRIECAVDRAPVDVLAGRRLVDDETVHRRTAGAVAGVAHQCAVGRQLAFVALDGQLDQLGGAEIIVCSGRRHRVVPGLLAGRFKVSGVSGWPGAEGSVRPTAGDVPAVINGARLCQKGKRMATHELTDWPWLWWRCGDCVPGRQWLLPRLWISWSRSTASKVSVRPQKS